MKKNVKMLFVFFGCAILPVSCSDPIVYDQPMQQQVHVVHHTSPVVVHRPIVVHSSPVVVQKTIIKKTTVIPKTSVMRSSNSRTVSRSSYQPRTVSRTTYRSSTRSSNRR